MGSHFGALIQLVGASWMMTSMGSPQMVALVQTAASLPLLLLALFAGAVADNIDRRKVMLVAQAFMLIVSAALCVCAWMNLLTAWLLLLFTFLVSCGATMNGSAWMASVGDLVPRAQLPGAVTLNAMGFNIARSAGPAIGGAIIATAGAVAAFLTNTLSYIGLIVVLARWRPTIPPRLLPRERLVLAMTAGLRYAAMSPNLRAVLARAALFGFAASAITAMMPLVARQLVAGGSLTYGVLLGAFGVGAVGGAMSSGWLRARLSPEAIVHTSSVAVALGTAATALSPIVWLTLPPLMITGAGWLLGITTLNATVQMASPNWVLARALSKFQMCAFGGVAVGSWIFGTIADHHGLRIALLTAAAVQLLVMLLARLLPLPNVEKLNLDPLDSWSEPETKVPVSVRTGPIVIIVEHRIAEADIVPFLSAMSERRRIRRRDGAHGWTLMRDLADSELWVERYHFATWLDYVRHNQRRTVADAENIELLRSLLKNEFVVRRMIERQIA